MTQSFLGQELLGWYSKEKRHLPWRETSDPYTIWISEVILQQTRVAQGLPYFHRFIEAFPAVASLAGAEEDQVLRLWEGLGYYSRARNLHQGAKYVHGELGGIFPDNYEGLLKIKGIGPYTASAIASICFGRPTPVLDGNVFRVVSRYFGVFDDISQTKTRKVFGEILEKIMVPEHPGDFNQAMMELGAVVCSPSSPSCDQCPISAGCFALRERKQGQLPVKLKKVKKRNRYFHYLVLSNQGQVSLKKRNSEDVWKGLYEFFLIESDSSDFPTAMSNKINFEIDTRATYQKKHILTHQNIFGHFYEVVMDDKKLYQDLVDKLELESFSFADVLDLPKPKLIVNYLTERYN